MDLASLDKWDEVHKGQADDVRHTHRTRAVDRDQRGLQELARLNAMRYILNQLPYAGKDPDAGGEVDPLLVGRPGTIHSNGHNGKRRGKQRR